MNILIVEDQATMRASLRAYVQAAFPQASVIEATCVATALRQRRVHQPRLALVDVLLPDGNGIELTKELRAAQTDLPVVVVSLLAGQTYSDMARAAGAHAYVVKDRLVVDLLPAMRSALGLRHPS